MSVSRTARDRTICLVAGVALAAAAACGPNRDKAPTTDPKDLSTTDKVRMAESYRRAGRMGDALDILKQALEERPEQARLHSVYGQYLFYAGRYADAEVALMTALELDPYLSDARNWLGATYTEQQRYAEAEREYRRALSDAAYPTPEMIYFNLGRLYDVQGREREAIGEIRRALEINPRFYRAHYDLAQLLERSGKLEEAAREFEVAEPAYREVGEYHYRRGFVYFRLGRREEARVSLERCLAVSPGSPSAAEAGELLKVMN